MSYRVVGATLLGLCLAGGAWGQTLGEGVEALNKKYRDQQQLIRQLFNGEVVANPMDKQHVDAVDMAARSALYRLHLGHPEKEPGGIDGVFKRGIETDLGRIAKFKTMSPALGQMYGPAARAHALEVIGHGEALPLARMNAARALARLAELGQPELADDLVKLLDDVDSNDGVRYWSLRGLRDMLAQPGDTTPVLSKERQAKVVGAVLKFVERTKTFPRNTPKAEVEGFKVLRREAVRALAQVNAPALGDKDPPALALLRVVAGDPAVVPPPRLDERLEAAIGLARMKPALAKDYQPDVAAFYIASFLREFARQCGDNITKPASERERPWKVDGARLADALAVLKAEANKNAYVDSVVAKCTPVVSALEQGKSPDPSSLGNWLDNNNGPKGKELFKGVAESAVKEAKTDE